jgi:hypothetical protein
VLEHNVAEERRDPRDQARAEVRRHQHCVQAVGEPAQDLALRSSIKQLRNNNDRDVSKSLPKENNFLPKKKQAPASGHQVHHPSSKMTTRERIVDGSRGRVKGVGRGLRLRRVPGLVEKTLQKKTKPKWAPTRHQNDHEHVDGSRGRVEGVGHGRWPHRVAGLDEGRDEDPDGVVREQRGGDGADGEPGGAVVHSTLEKLSRVAVLCV